MDVSVGAFKNGVQIAKPINKQCFRIIDTRSGGYLDGQFEDKDQAEKECLRLNEKFS